MITPDDFMRQHGDRLRGSGWVSDEEAEEWRETLCTMDLATGDGVTVTHLQSKLAGLARFTTVLKTLVSRIEPQKDTSRAIVCLVDGELAFESLSLAVRVDSDISPLLESNPQAAGKIQIIRYRDVMATAPDSWGTSEITFLLELGCGLHTVDMVLAAGTLLERISVAGKTGSRRATNVVTLSTSEFSIFDADIVQQYTGVPMEQYVLPASMAVPQQLRLSLARPLVPKLLEPPQAGQAAGESADGSVPVSADATSKPADTRRHLILWMSRAEGRDLMSGLNVSAEGHAVIAEAVCTASSPAGSISQALSFEQAALCVDQGVTLWAAERTPIAVVLSALSDPAPRFDRSIGRVVTMQAKRSPAEVYHASTFSTAFQASGAPAVAGRPPAILILNEQDVKLASGVYPAEPAFHKDLERLIFSAVNQWPGRRFGDLPLVHHPDWRMTADCIWRLTVRKCLERDMVNHAVLRVAPGRAQGIYHFLSLTESFEASYLLSGVSMNAPERIRRVLIRIACLISRGVTRFWGMKEPLRSIGMDRVRALCRGAGRTWCKHGAIWTALGLFDDSAEIAVASEHSISNSDADSSTRRLLGGKIRVEKPQIVAGWKLLTSLEQTFALQQEYMTSESLSEEEKFIVDKELVRTFFHSLVVIFDHDSIVLDCTSGRKFERGDDEAVDLKTIRSSDEQGALFGIYTDCIKKDNGYIVLGLTAVQTRAVTEVAQEFGAGDNLIGSVRSNYWILQSAASSTSK